MSDQENLQYENTLFQMIGGEEMVRRIVEAFYPLVQADQLLGPLFPENIDPVMEKQYLFLTQFFGGPPLFSQQYGHPMMRARHMPFEITPQRADAWLGCMEQALISIGIEPELRNLLLQRLQAPAYHFVNTDK